MHQTQPAISTPVAHHWIWQSNSSAKPPRATILGQSPQSAHGDLLMTARAETKNNTWRFFQAEYFFLIVSHICYLYL